MTTVKRFESGLEIFIIVLVFAATNMASEIYQQPIAENNGKGFDGVFYYEIAQQITNDIAPHTDAPFVYRVGTPFLASLFFKESLVIGFKIINIVANLLSTILLILWLRLYLHDFRIRVFLVILFITQWHGPIRFVYFYPVSSDPWLYVFLLLGLIGIHKFKNRPDLGNTTLLGLVSLIGVMFREVVLVVSVALIFSTNPIPRIHGNLRSWFNLGMQQVRPRLIHVLHPLLFGIAGAIAVRCMVSQTNDYSFIKSTISWAYNKPLLSYIQAYFVSYGPVIMIPVVYWRRTINFLWANQSMLVYLVGFMVLAWVGGSDTERFLFWGMPIVYLLVGRVMQEKVTVWKSLWFVIFALLSQLVSQRICWTIPDYANGFLVPIPVLTIPSSRFNYLDLWSYHGRRIIQFISLIEYLLVAIVGSLWLQRLETLARSKRDSFKKNRATGWS